MVTVLGRTFHPMDRAVDVHISHLRRKLGPYRTLIVTVRSVGYLLRLVLIALVIMPGPANAQTEDLERRSIGGAGANAIGLSGFIDKFMSTAAEFPWQLTVHVDFTRFLTDKIALRGGLIGANGFGGEVDEDSEVTGPGALALYAHGGVAYYFTPESMASLYAGGEYRAQLTHRPERDAGTVLGKGGVQAAVSSRVSAFVEAGYGFRLTRGSEDERQTRIVAEIGLRIKF